MNTVSNIRFYANTPFKGNGFQLAESNAEVSMPLLQQNTVEVKNKQNDNNREKKTILALLAGAALIIGAVLLTHKKPDAKTEKKIVQGLSDTFEANKKGVNSVSEKFSIHEEPWRVWEETPIHSEETWSHWDEQQRIFEDEWRAWDEDFTKKWEQTQKEWAEQDAKWAKQTAEWEKQTAEWEKWAKGFKDEPNAESFHNDIPFEEKTNQHSTSSAKPKVIYEHPGVTVFKKYGQDLGDISNLTKESLKKAYIELVKKHHPDANKGNEAMANEILKEINNARDALIKEIKMRETRS